MNKPSLLFFCHAYTEQQIWVVCKILLKGKHVCFRAPVLQHLSLKPKRTQIHTQVSCLKCMEIQTVKAMKFIPFSCNYCIISLFIGIHQPDPLIHLLNNSFSFQPDCDSHENPYLYWLFVVRSAFTFLANSIKK